MASMLTLPNRLKHWSTVDPDKPAFIFTDSNWRRRVYSRKDVFELSSKYAAILQREGVTRGDIVCNALPNSPERLITDFGCALAGAVILNGQVLLADGNDFFGSLMMANCRAVIIDAEKSKGAKFILEQHDHKQHGTHVNYPELPCLRLVLACHWDSNEEKVSLMDLIKNETETFVVDVEPDEEAYIFTTSGSTGFSKLVPRTNEELFCVSEHFAWIIDAKKDDIYFNDRPLGWAGGYPYVYLINGATRVLTDLSKGSPSDQMKFTWELICKEKCNIAFMVPLHLESLAHTENTWKSSTWKLKHVTSGGQPLRKVHMAAIGKITDAVIVAYGSTEAGIITSKKVTNVEHFDDCNNGVPLEGGEVKVVDKAMNELPVGQMGEILIRGNQVCRYYLSNKKANEESLLPDGWFRSGDVGYKNKDGESYVICREKFAIMRGSYIVYPGWLEVRILNCPGVLDVVIVPVPDPVLYQEMCACLLCLPGTEMGVEEVENYCKSLFLTKESSEMTAVPKYYLFFTSFPTSASGKTCRKTIEKLALQRLGLDTIKV